MALLFLLLDLVLTDLRRRDSFLLYVLVEFGHFYFVSVTSYINDLRDIINLNLKMAGVQQ